MVFTLSIVLLIKVNKALSVVRHLQTKQIPPIIIHVSMQLSIHFAEQTNEIEKFSD